MAAVFVMIGCLVATIGAICFLLLRAARTSRDEVRKARRETERRKRLRNDD